MKCPLPSIFVADPNLSPKISAHSERRGNGTKEDTEGRFWSNRIFDVSKNAVETDLLALKKHHMDFFYSFLTPNNPQFPNPQSPILTTIWLSQCITVFIHLSTSEIKLPFPHLLFFPGTEASEARAANSQLQAVHREVISSHHTGRPDPERDWPRPLPADCQEHQWEVRQHAVDTHDGDIRNVPAGGKEKKIKTKLTASQPWIYFEK